MTWVSAAIIVAAVIVFAVWARGWLIAIHEIAIAVFDVLDQDSAGDGAGNVTSSSPIVASCRPADATPFRPSTFDVSCAEYAAVHGVVVMQPGRLIGASISTHVGCC